MKYGGEESRQFVTNLGLVTSNGKWGHNIMTAEWAHHISYDPAMVVINVHDYDATADNIIGSKEFGVSLASESQAELIWIAGHASGKKSNKIAALEELGFRFYKAGKIGTYMVEGAVLNLECRLVKYEKIGDHIMFIGEVLEAKANETEGPAIFRSGTGIYKVGERLKHSDGSEREKRVEEALSRHTKANAPA